MPEGFTLGDHRFLHPSETGPLSRFKARKRQIIGAPPPSCFDGLMREATPKSPAAKALFKGKFCGHGEPTMTIFDVVIDGEEFLEITALTDDQDPSANLPCLAVRKPGGRWIALFRREWEESQATLEGVAPSPLTEAEIAQLNPDTGLGRLAVGFEYPCDATSRDCVSWMTVDALFDGNRKPSCLVNAELA